MKKNLTQFIKIAVVALVIGLGVSAASAWTAPGTGSVKTAPIDGNVAASINLGDFDQIKKGGIIIPVVNKKFVSPLAFFKKTLLPGKDSAVYIGGSGTADPDFTTQFPGTPTAPLTINLAQRADPTGAIQFKTAELCPVSTKLVNTNAAAFEFWNLDKNTNADIIAKQIRLDGGKPGLGKILIAVDNKGRAVWATPKLATNGKDVIFDTHDDSPVGLCNNIVPPAVTYTWSSGTWGTCTSSYPTDWTDFVPSPSMLTWGAKNQSCQSWISSQDNNYKNGTQTRSVTCQDSNGNTVADGLCTGTKPSSTQACTAPLQYRGKLYNGGSTNYTNPGYCVYGKLPFPDSTDPYANLFAEDCKTAKLTDPVPSGYNPVNYCGQIVGAGGSGSCIGFGFNAGNPGGCTITVGNASLNLQVKKQ